MSCSKLSASMMRSPLESVWHFTSTPKRQNDPLHTAIYSHGHVDHVFGVPVFEAEAKEKGFRPPQVLAHEAMPARSTATS